MADPSIASLLVCALERMRDAFEEIYDVTYEERARDVAAAGMKECDLLIALAKSAIEAEQRIEHGPVIVRNMETL